MSSNNDQAVGSFRSKQSRWQHGARLTLGLVLGAFLVANLHAKDANVMVTELSIDDLARQVLQSNPEYQAAQKLKDQSRAAITTARALSNPRLEWSQGRSSARMPGAVPGPMQSWSVSQFIENPSARGARIESAQQGERENFHQVAVARQELVAEVQSRTYEYFFRKETEKVLKEDLELLMLVRDRTRVRVNSGEVPRYELIKADAEVINAKQRFETSGLQAQQVLLGINRLAAGRLPANWVPRGMLGDEFELPTLENIQSNAQRLNPELMALQSRVARLEKTLSATRSARLPGVEIRYTQFRDIQLSNNMLGVSVQIPLLDGRQGPIAEASAELERARLTFEGRQAELSQQILQAWKALEIARSRVDALSQGAVREAESALRVAQAAYRFGERGILDVLDAQRLLQSVRTNLLDARFQLQAARIQLDLLSGKNAEFNY